MLDSAFFHDELPSRPMGKYAHIVMLRVTQGYTQFQTDGELNWARVARGSIDDTPISRIIMFKRKQTTPERLNGRELLRRYGLLSSSEDENDPDSCIYNVKSCKKCPDCITYGFAIGGGGSEKSKVYTDTAFSLTDYEVSHEVFTLNAPFEDGTMFHQDEVTYRLNKQFHVKPQVIFPAVVTTRDLTFSLFNYVLNNVIRTNRYGAATTRGGTMRNYVVAIILNDGEIFSNLLFTQRLHDVLQPHGSDPVSISAALSAATETIPALLAEDGVRDQQVLLGSELKSLLQQMLEIDQTILDQARQQTLAYYKAYVAGLQRKA